MDRRAFLKAGLGISTVTMLSGAPRIAAATSEDTVGARWRRFEITTRAEIGEARGVTRVWLPAALTPDTDYFRNLGQTWTGNADLMRIVRDEKYGAEIFYAQWSKGAGAPVVQLTSTFATRDRAVNPYQPGTPGRDDKATLAKYLAPTTLIKTDGIVREKAIEITKGLRTDLEKSRAVYEWIVENTFRDPKVRGCGVGDIGWMLESGNLGGKCADLNALYVGLVRALGIPARDIYGVRVADSAEFKSLGKSGDITKAQHCRAEFYLPSHGWVPVDPADVRKVALEEPPGNIALDDAKVVRARTKLFGAWEMNYLPFNYAHDVKLPGSDGLPIAFFMYPQAETGDERRDSLDPESFAYKMTAREITT
jgi:transglutaminase-like putative cysteine protease